MTCQWTSPQILCSIGEGLDVGPSDERRGKETQAAETAAERYTNLNQNLIKTSPNLAKFWGHDLYGLVNTSPKGLDEMLHGLREINEERSQNGVFDIFPKLRSRGARDFQGVSTRLRGLKSHQRFPRIQETSSWSPQNKNTSKREKSSTKSKRGGKGRSDQHKGESLSTKLIFD